MRLAAVIAAVVTLLAAAPASAKRLVTYTRTGGLVGLSDRLTISTGGKARLNGEAFRIGERRLRALGRDLRAARFRTLRPRYEPERPIADGITQTVRHRGRTVAVEQGGDPPERLERVLERLAAIAR